jgi:hypothetical protein
VTRVWNTEEAGFGFDCRWVRRLLSTPRRDQLWNQTSFLSIEHRILFPEGKTEKDIKLPTHLRLVPRCISRSTVPSLTCISRRGSEAPRHRSLLCNTIIQRSNVNSDSNAILLHAGTGPEGSRRLMLPEILDNRHMKVIRLSAYAPVAFTSQEMLQAETTPRP